MNSANYNHFYYFYIIAKLEGVSTAAKHLNTSQSSLSSQIKVLESQLGFSLFKKSGRKIQLTAEGREIFQYCRRSFENFEEMFDQIVNPGPKAMGTNIQQIMNALNYKDKYGKDISVGDGYGTESRTRLNLLIEDGLDVFITKAMNMQQANYYLQRTLDNPKKRKYYKGWLLKRCL